MRARATVQLFTLVLIGGVVSAQQNRNSAPPEQTNFGLEESVVHPVPLPQGVLKILAEDDLVRRRCSTDEGSVGVISASWFEASQVHLDGPAEVDLLVKARNGCLFGANIGPFWIFQNSPKGYKLILSVSALGIELTRNKSNGLRDVSAGAVAGGKAVSVTFRFDGQTYKQSGTKTEESVVLDMSWKRGDDHYGPNFIHLESTCQSNSEPGCFCSLDFKATTSGEFANYVESFGNERVPVTFRVDYDDNRRVLGAILESVGTWPENRFHANEKSLATGFRTNRASSGRRLSNPADCFPKPEE